MDKVSVMKKRILLILAIFVICAGGTYYTLKPNGKKQTEKALTQFKHHQYNEAEKTLQTLPASHLTYPLTFYKGYLEQAKGNYHLSDQYLEKALRSYQRERKQQMLLEIAVAQASNAFFDGRDGDLIPLVNSAKALAPSHPFLTFFEGLSNYIQKRYKEALKSWNGYSQEEYAQSDSWMSSSIEALFPVSWRQMHVAHCLAEEDSLQTSREILEKESHKLGSQQSEEQHLANLFLGLTYLKEAHQVPLEQRGSYYKLARFYFERSETGERYTREKTCVVSHIEEEAQSLLLARLSPDQLKWGFDFVRTLEEWKAIGSLDRLTSSLAEKLVREKGAESLSFCESVRKSFLNTPFHTLLTEKLLSSVTCFLRRGEGEDLLGTWSLVAALSPNPKLLAKQVASFTAVEIFETIKQDDPNLTRTNYFVSFWEELGKSPQERAQFARQLMTHAKLFWHHEHQEDKGQRLMDLAIRVTQKNPAVQKDIETFLTGLYAQAESSNMIRRLSLIYDALDHFQISRQELVSKSKIANHLADAEYLYASSNYPSAKTHALWVLKLDPHNTGATRLVGLCSFHQGDYLEAFNYLQEVGPLDEQTHKALVLSQAFAIQEQEKHLCQMDITGSFNVEE